MKERSTIIKQLGLDDSKKDVFEMLAKQVQAEYDLAWRHQKPRKDELEVRLRLYNNQRRDKKAVGDTTLFTIFQTVLASLYIDRLNAMWGAREQGDEEVAENLNALSRYDYDEMGKDIVDYNWIWDTLFSGRGLIDISEYRREPENNIYVPLPKNIDFIPFLRDPLATSVNGDAKLRGQARFYGYEVKMTKHGMEDHPHILEGVKFNEIKHGSGTHSILRDAIEARVQASGNQTVSKEDAEAKLGANAQYDITEWNTNFEVEGEEEGKKVKKIKVWLANDRSKVVGVEILKNDMWPVIDRALYPTSHDWDGTSIPDLTEDKQRAKAIAQNLGLNAMKADLYPMYIYDSNRITNRNDLNFDFNKFIPVDVKDRSVGDALMPLNKAKPNMGLLDFVYRSLDTSAQIATATPDIQQGAQSANNRPLGETNLIASKVDTRYSLSAKIFGWSEKRFWRAWYQSYKDNFKENIDEKVVRIVGAFGAKWRPLMRDNIIANIDPDVEIESQVVSRAKQLEDRQTMTEYVSLIIDDPTVNKRYALKKLGKLNGLQKDEIDRLWPPTVDERIAEEENDRLNNDEYVPVLAEDDHLTHLEVHNKANETKAADVHIKTHIKALSVKKANPELFPKTQEDLQMDAMKQQPQMNKPKPIKPSATSNSPSPMMA